MAQIDLKNTTIRFIDGTPVTPKTLDIQVGDGNLTYSQKQGFKYILDRGLLNTVRKEDQIPLDVSFDLIWDFLTFPSGSLLYTPEDFLKKRGAASANISAGADSCEPYAIKIEIFNQPPCTVPAFPNEKITITEFRYETLAHDLRAGTLAVTGKAKIEFPTVVRS